jgi:mono/diheme cytochrome c family protein
MHQGTPSQLAIGRKLYVTKCAACHSVEPVRNYSREKWEHEILPDMVEETNLSEAETAAVRAYVLSVLKSPVAAEG